MLTASVITVCYNSEKTILDTIQSVNGQTYPKIEHLIIDGLSKDSTVDLAAKNAVRNPKIYSEEDYGIFDAMNKGISRSSGDVIFILNSDDKFDNSEVIAMIMNYFNSDPLLEMLLTNVAFCDFKSSERSLIRQISIKYYHFSFIRFGWMPPHPGVIMTKNFIKKCGKYKLHYKVAADYEYLVRAYYKYKPKYKKLAKNSVIMRPGGNSTQNIMSNFIITNEIKMAFSENNKFTSYIILVPRFVIKPLTQIIFPYLRYKIRSILKLGQS